MPVFNGKNVGAVFFAVVVIIALFLVFNARLENVSPFLNQDPMNGSDALGKLDNSGNPIVGQKSSSVSVEAFFCPQDNCADKLIKKIDLADKNIFVAIYSFTHDGIADALVRAKQRGVEVMVIFDSDQSMGDSSDDEKLFQAGVKVARRNGSGYMHNKFAVIDAKLVATGSFNYSQNADTKNEENLVFINDSVIASEFKNDFDLIWDKSVQVS